MNVESAAVTARAVSRRLRRAGLPMSRVEGRSATEGLYAHRVGYSSLVAVGYTLHERLLGRSTADERRRRDGALAAARDVLAGAGYPLEAPNGWKAGLYIRCSGE
jgi:N-acyl-L-homoserine lactone synthetase